MKRAEKWYGWIIVVVAVLVSFIHAFQYITFYRHSSGVRDVDGAFFLFAVAVPVVLVVGWLWVKKRLDSK